MTYSFYSKKFKQEITFSRPGKSYIYIDMDGKHPGTLGDQICSGGSFFGSTLSCYGDSEEFFELFCKRWWRSYLRKSLDYEF